MATKKSKDQTVCFNHRHLKSIGSFPFEPCSAKVSSCYSFNKVTEDSAEELLNKERKKKEMKMKENQNNNTYVLASSHKCCYDKHQEEGPFSDLTRIPNRETIEPPRQAYRLISVFK